MSDRELQQLSRQQENSVEEAALALKIKLGWMIQGCSGCSGFKVLERVS
jgi:hypothetical protein